MLLFVKTFIHVCMKQLFTIPLIQNWVQRVCIYPTKLYKTVRSVLLQALIAHVADHLTRGFRGPGFESRSGPLLLLSSRLNTSFTSWKSTGFFNSINKLWVTKVIHTCICILYTFVFIHWVGMYINLATRLTACW